MTAPTRSRITGADCYWPRAILHLDLSPWLAALNPDDGTARATRVAPVWQALSALSTDIEWTRGGEMFIDVTHVQRRHGTPEQLARDTQARIAATTGGWPRAIGVAATRLGARYASTIITASGINVIAPWEARERLRDVAVEKVFPAGPRMIAFLAGHGAATCGDVAALPSELLARRFGVVGRQLWLACQGRDTGAAVRDVEIGRAHV
jgi:DNA polymerase-4